MSTCPLPQSEVGEQRGFCGGRASICCTLREPPCLGSVPLLWDKHKQLWFRTPGGVQTSPAPPPAAPAGALPSGGTVEAWIQTAGRALPRSRASRPPSTRARAHWCRSPAGSGSAHLQPRLALRAWVCGDGCDARGFRHAQLRCETGAHSRLEFQMALGGPWPRFHWLVSVAQPVTSPGLQSLVALKSPARACDSKHSGEASAPSQPGGHRAWHPRLRKRASPCSSGHC